jgi:hypothetical protein
MPRRAVELPVLLPWLRRQSFSFPGRDAGQSPSSVVTPVSLLRLLPTSCRRSASSFPALVALLPTPRRRPASSACTPHRTAGQPRPPAPHSAPPVSCSQRHTAGQAPPPRALLSSSTHAHVAIEVIRGRERVHMEGQRDPTSPLFQARLRRLLETKVVSWRAKFALWRSDKEAAGDSLTWCRKSSYTRTEISYSFWLSYINASKKRCC